MEKETKSIYELIADSKKHNGWTNYETWRIHLEHFSDGDPAEHIMDNENEYDLAHSLRERIEGFIDDFCEEPLIRGYVHVFLAEVNWYEIARHLLENNSTYEQDSSSSQRAW